MRLKDYGEWIVVQGRRFDINECVTMDQIREFPKSGWWFLRPAVEIFRHGQSMGTYSTPFSFRDDSDICLWARQQLAWNKHFEEVQLRTTIDDAHQTTDGHSS